MHGVPSGFSVRVHPPVPEQATDDSHGPGAGQGLAEPLQVPLAQTSATVQGSLSSQAPPERGTARHPPSDRQATDC